MPNDTLKSVIRDQREKLTARLSRALRTLGKECVPLMGDRAALEDCLIAGMEKRKNCKHFYVLNADGQQITANVNRNDVDNASFGRERMGRPYMQGLIGSTDFKLSDAYISRNTKRPMLTAMKVLRDADRNLVGFLGADYDLRELPATKGMYKESQAWQQIKGDPAIRGGLFQQERSQSLMDDELNDILPLMTALMTEHGVFHGKLHFASSRATIWLVDDPYAYRLLGFDDLMDPDVCLAYPARSYTKRATVPAEAIAPIFEMFRELRFADDNVYLRAGSLNVVNGMVGLNFSCDGSHYIRYDEFLEKGLDFWFGGSAAK